MMSFVFRRISVVILIVVPVLADVPVLAGAEPPCQEGRPAKDAAELDYWLANMVAHQFSQDEVAQALGISAAEARQQLDRFAKLAASERPTLGESGELLVLPYPGGRHPRIGFLDGAVCPQRESKVSVFAPWKDGGYLVVDVPEAVWHQRNGKRELLYLAHTHVPTVWDQQGVRLQPLEWNRDRAGELSITRTFPNKVSFTTRVKVVPGGVRMDFSITNGSTEPLTGLDVQMCGMLKGLNGFNEQHNDNKIFKSPFAACRNVEGNRWVILGFDHCNRAWGNAPCPCLHADPRVPDCAPGETQTVHGWVSFYEGTEIEAELRLRAKFRESSAAPGL